MDRHRVLIEYSADTSGYAAQAARMRREIDKLNASILASQSSAKSLALTDLNRTFSSDLKAMRQWSTGVVSMENGAVQLGKSIEKNNLSMQKQVALLKEYRRGAVGSRGAVSELAKEQVRMSRSVVSFYQDAQGKQQARVSTPLGVNMKDVATRTAVANQEMQVYNRLLQQNAEKTINWGKNTQWAGRQIMVGLTVPMIMFGAAAKNVFIEVDKEMTRLGKVYGAGIAGASDQAVAQIKQDVYGLGSTLAREWGVALKDTAGLAAQVAATGKEGNDLLTSTREAMRLSVLGEVDRQTAMEATLSLQNAFKISNEDLAGSIDFLNAVENQTSTSLEDLAIAIPKAGPVVRSLGGDVKDLALLMTAMKEGGIDAAEGANALKSGLASMINPSKQAQEAAKGLGIDLVGIVEANRGQLIPTITEFQKALQGLDEFSRAQLIEQIFGKYQFARISALFDNFNKQGSQTKQVFELMGASAADLAANSEREMKRLTESTSMQWQRAVESFKANLVPVGEAITKVFTTVLKGANWLLEVFEKLPDPIKGILGGLAGISALVGPFLMILGIFGNFIGQLKNGWAMLRGRQGGLFSMLTQDVIAAEAATSRLVNAQFNEQEALMEINSVMEKQILLLKALSEAQEGVAASSAQMSNTMGAAAGAMAGGRGGMRETTEGSTVGDFLKGSIRKDGEVSARTALALDPALAREWAEGLSGGTQQGRVLGDLTATDSDLINRIGADLERQIANGISPEAAVASLEKQLVDAGKSPEVARRARSFMAGMIGRMDLVDEADRGTVERFNRELADDPNSKKRRSGFWTMLTGAASAQGVGMNAPEMGYHASHATPLSRGGGFLQMMEWSQPNYVRGDRQMEDPLRIFGREGKLNLMAALGLSEVAGRGEQGLTDLGGKLGDDGKRTSGGVNSAPKTGGLAIDQDRMVADVTARINKLFAEAAKLNVPVERYIEGLIAQGVSLEEATSAVNDSTSSYEESAQRARELADAESRRVDAERKAVESVDAYESAMDRKTAADKQYVDSARKSVEALNRVGTGGWGATKIAGSLEQYKQILSNPMDAATIARLEADMEKVDAAINSTDVSDAARDFARRLKASIEAALAAEAARVNALGAADEQKVSATELRAAEIEYDAAKLDAQTARENARSAATQTRAADRQLAAGNLEVAANTEEALGVDGSRGRMGGFLQRAEAKTMGLGMGAMGVGMLTGNEVASQAGMALSAVSMVTMALEPLRGMFGTATAAVKLFGLAALTAARNVMAGGVSGGLSGAITGIRAGFTGLAGAIGPQAPLMLGIAAAAAAMYGLYKIWDNNKKRQEREERSYQTKWDIVNVKSGKAIYPESGLEYKGVGAARENYEKSDGAKSITEDIKKATSESEKKRLLEENYRSQLLTLEAAYPSNDKRTEDQKKEYEERVNFINSMFAVISEEADVAGAWAEAKESGGKTLLETLRSDLKNIEGEKEAINNTLLKNASNPSANLLRQNQLAAVDNAFLEGLPDRIASALSAALGSGSDSTVAKTLADAAVAMDELSDSGKMSESTYAGIASKVKEIAGINLPTWDEFVKSGGDAEATVDKVLTELGLIPRHIAITLTINEQIDYINAQSAIASEMADLKSQMEKELSSDQLADNAEKSYDAMVKGAENANDAAEKAHERAQDRRQEVADAKREEIDGIREKIDAINEEADAKKRAFDEAKKADDYFRDKKAAQLEYERAMAEGDTFGAAKIQNDMLQAEADYNSEQTVSAIDRATEKRTAALEAKIDAIEREIEAIDDASKAADKAFEKEQEQRKARLAAIQENKDAWIAAEKARTRAAFESEKRKRTEAWNTAQSQLKDLDYLAQAGLISQKELEAQSAAIFKNLATKMGWDAQKTADFKESLINPILDAWETILKVIGITDSGFEKRRKQEREQAAAYAAKRRDDAEPKSSSSYSGRGYSVNHSGAFVRADHTTGSGDVRSDESVRKLQVGEYVVRRAAVNRYGKGFFDNLNSLSHTEGRGAPTIVQMAANNVARKAMHKKVVQFAQDSFLPDLAMIKYGISPGNPLGTPSADGIRPKWSGNDLTGASASARAAVSRAMSDLTNEIGYCLRQVREWWGVPGKYGSAAIAWENSKQKHRNASPKIGAPVFWTGGRDGYGHVAMYIGNGKVRSTDAAGPGRVGTVPMSNFGGSLRFQGWTGDLNDVALQLRKGGVVLKDNTLANLHKSEAVLRAPVASSLEDGIKGISRVPDIIKDMDAGSKVIDQSTHKNYFNISQLPGESTEELSERIVAKQREIYRRTGKG